jgi:hypothetical protein
MSCSLKGGGNVTLWRGGHYRLRRQAGVRISTPLLFHLQATHSVTASANLLLAHTKKQIPFTILYTIILKSICNITKFPKWSDKEVSYVYVLYLCVCFCIIYISWYKEVCSLLSLCCLSLSVWFVCGLSLFTRCYWHYADEQRLVL